MFARRVSGDAQEHRCFYTNEIMETKLGDGIKRNQLSVDRIIPENGYTKENIVFCLYIVNNAKTDLTIDELRKWIPDWYNKIQIKLSPINLP